jgi:hypothetical protein
VDLAGGTDGCHWDRPVAPGSPPAPPIGSRRRATPRWASTPRAGACGASAPSPAPPLAPVSSRPS